MEIVEIYKISKEIHELQDSIIISDVECLLTELNELSDSIFDSLMSSHKNSNIEDGVIIYVLNESYNILQHFPYHSFNISDAINIIEKYRSY